MRGGKQVLPIAEHSAGNYFSDVSRVVAAARRGPYNERKKLKAKLRTNATAITGFTRNVFPKFY